MALDDSEAQQRSDNCVQRARRSSTLMSAKCHRQDGTVYKITVRNASATGLLGSYREAMNFTLGEKVTLGFRDLTPIAASVVWCENGQVGIGFASSVNVELLFRNHSQAAAPLESPRSETMRDWIDRARRDSENARAQRKAANLRTV